MHARTAPVARIALLLLAAACSGGDARAYDREADRRAERVDGASVGVSSSSVRYVRTLTGLHNPESARYDPDQDVFFISNMNGHGSVKDGNGYIVRVSAADLDRADVFIASGRNGAVLDAPKGITLSGDTLWVADIDKLRGFHRVTGAPLAVVDFAPLGARLLNDVDANPAGEIRVSDTGLMMTADGVWYLGPARIFGVGPGARPVEIARGDSLGHPIGHPNGIRWDAAAQRWLVVSFEPFTWAVKTFAGRAVTDILSERRPAELDGLDVLPSGAILYTSWQDSSLHLLEKGRDRTLIRELREPADIGVDTRRHRVAIPMPITGWVQLWNLNAEGR